MEQWGRFLADVLIWPIAVVAAFEGMRRIRNGRRTKEAVLLLAFGLIWCVAKGGLTLYMGATANELRQSGNIPTHQLSDDWGRNMAPAERESGSLAYARVAFLSNGVLLDYFTQSGERKRFAPLPEDVRERDSTVQLWQQFDDGWEHAYKTGVRMIVSALVAMIAGAVVGAKSDV
jgi:hypothetical protein